MPLDFIYIDVEKMCLNGKLVDEVFVKPEDCDCSIWYSKKLKQTAAKESANEIFTFRKLAEEYFNTGMIMLNAKHSLEEEYYELLKTPLLTTK